MSPRKKKMKLYTVRVKMEDLCCPVWREVTIPSILVLHDVYRIILEAFGWDDESSYLFQFKKGNYVGNQEKGCMTVADWNLALDSKTVGNETLEEVLGNSKVFNLIFISDDFWCCHATVTKKPSVDMDLFPFECLAGEGACPSSLFERKSLFNEAYLIMTDPNSDPDAKEEVDAFLKDSGLYMNGQWPGEFNLDAANKRLDNLKERMKDELKEYMTPSVQLFEEDYSYDEIPSHWVSDWMDDVNDSDNTPTSSADDSSQLSTLSDSLYSSFVELFKINNIPCDGVDFNKKDISQFDFDALFKKLKKSSDPQMKYMLENLQSALLAFNFLHLMEDVSESDPDKKTSEKKTKSKKTSAPKTSKKKKSDDNDDKK